jgi:hypothetical protein
MKPHVTMPIPLKSFVTAAVSLFIMSGAPVGEGTTVSFKVSFVALPLNAVKFWSACPCLTDTARSNSAAAPHDFIARQQLQDTKYDWQRAPRHLQLVERQSGGTGKKEYFHENIYLRAHSFACPPSAHLLSRLIRNPKVWRGSFLLSIKVTMNRFV